jgi:hypothetical protein
MKYEVIIITHPEKDVEGEHFKKIKVECDQVVLDHASRAYLFNTEDDLCVLSAPVGSVLVKLISK